MNNDRRASVYAKQRNFGSKLASEQSDDLENKTVAELRKIADGLSLSATTKIRKPALLEMIRGVQNQNHDGFTPKQRKRLRLKSHRVGA